MAIEERKNYNLWSLKGHEGWSDMDIVEHYNLDPSLAYTPALNKAAIRAQYEWNVQAGLKRGLTQKDAESHAGKLRKQAEQGVKDTYKELGIKF